MKFRIVLLMCFALLTTAGTAAAADEGQFRVLSPRFSVYLGGFFAEVDSKISIDGTRLPDNPVLDLENVFDLEDSKATLWGGARWHISRRNSLEFEFVDLNREGTRGFVTDPIEVGDSIIQAGAAVDTTFDTTLGRLTYGFSIVKNERMDIQLKAGLHIADLSTSIGARGAVCVDGEIPPNCSFFASEPRIESEEVTAPLPHFGGSFIYGITPSVAARLQIIGFAIELDSVDGSIVELDADVVWQPWNHFGFGLGLRYFSTDVEGKGSDLNGKFEFEYFGPALYVLGTF